ncbi:MAG: esterase/lipase family protein [Burkholderiales bacterium]
MRDVVLVHGLWVPAMVMAPLATRLRMQGYRCHLFGYLGQGRPLEAHAERLARLGRGLGLADYVGHSLGGLVILEALQRHADLRVGHVVLMGTPARGNFAARRFARHALGRWFLGASEPLWREGRAAHWTRPEPLGVVAGTLPLGLGRLFGSLNGPSDGVVRLEETQIEGMRERVVLPVAHSGMLVSGRVATQVAAFLAHARFAHPR